MRRVALAVAGLALVAAVSAVAAGPDRDYAAIALDILPPGQYGGVDFNENSVDQLPLYDGLTPLFDQIKASDLPKYFKEARLWRGDEKAVRVERPRPGVRILRDTWGVPHIFADRENDLIFGAGWAAAEDRGLLLELARGPGRIAAIDAPGLNAFSLALSGKQFIPTVQTETFLAAQIELLERQGPLGRRFLAAIDAYVAGINAQYRSTRNPVPLWTRNDVVAMVALLGQRFGAGGGDETKRALFLADLRSAFGDAKAETLWNDLRLQNDPETPFTVAPRFPYEPVPDRRPGNVPLDVGSFQPAGAGAFRVAHEQMSNAILVGAKRSATGHPLMVAGPQLGFFYPEFFMELDLHGASWDVRGGALPGIPLILIGRGPDFAWSATSSQSDNVDTFVEELCSGDDVHYVFKGECRPMRRFEAGVLRGAPGTPERPVVFWETVHGPVIGYATSGGRRVALSRQRSTRGRELVSAPALYKLNTAAVSSGKDFVNAMGAVEMSFNLFYVDHRDIAYYSAGRLPLRAPGADPGLPTVGTGEYEWRGFLSGAGHPQAVNPPSGAIINWNNKPAPGFGSADDTWEYGPIHRATLLERDLAPGKNTLVRLVGAMNAAATQDIRAVELLPTLAAVLEGGPAPSGRAARMLGLLEDWRAKGGSRLDRDLDGKIDHPGAAIMDAAWPKLAETAMRPALGSMTDRLAELVPRFSISMVGGWQIYMSKDLRSLLGQKVVGPLTTRFCGLGDLGACRASLWAALDAAGAELEATQGSDPTAWRATAERITFAPGILRDTMRGSNRPTFQQVISFRTHR